MFIFVDAYNRCGGVDMRIVAVLGDFYHEQDALKKSLESVLEKFEGREIALDYVDRDALADYLTAEVDLVILGAENRLNPEDDHVKTWMTEEVSERIADYVSGGGAWLAWHAGMASYDDQPVYIDMLKGSFDYHPDDHQEVTYTLSANEVATLDKEQFSFLDEHYFVHCQTDETEVFMRSTSVDGEAEAGWYHQFGKGRVLCFVPAHNEEGLNDESVLSLLGQAIEWLVQ